MIGTNLPRIGPFGTAPGGMPMLPGMDGQGVGQGMEVLRQALMRFGTSFKKGVRGQQ